MPMALASVGLLDLDDLEAARERGVLLEVLLVFGPGRGGDRAQLAARQRRLEQVGGVALPGLAAGADHRVRLVDEQDDRLRRGLHLLDDRLQPVLELALDAGAGLQQAEVERAHGDVRSGGGTSPAAMRSAKPSTTAVLPTPASPVRIGLFCRRRVRMSMTWRISKSRPRTGSISPARARAGQVDRELVQSRRAPGNSRRPARRVAGRRRRRACRARGPRPSPPTILANSFAQRLDRDLRELLRDLARETGETRRSREGRGGGVPERTRAAPKSIEPTSQASSTQLREARRERRRPRVAGLEPVERSREVASRAARRRSRSGAGSA